MNQPSTNHPVDKVSESALTEFRKQLGAVIERVVEKTLQVDQGKEDAPDHSKLLPAGFEFTLKMLDGAASVGDLTLLEDQLKWAIQRLPHDGVAPHQLQERFETLVVILEEMLSAETWTEFKPYLAWMIFRQRELTANFSPPETA